MAASGHEHAETVEFFDRLAETWDSDEQNSDETLRRVEEIRDLLHLRSGDDLLEVGCGTGQLTAWLARQVSPGRVSAVDFSQKMLNVAKTKCDETKCDAAEFRLLDVCRDALEPNRFDVVFCFHCVPHFLEMPAAINNLARSLKPGGRLLVVHLNSRKEINRFHDRVGGAVAGHHLPDDERWETLLSDAGLEKTMLADGEGLYLLEAKRIEHYRP
jgi:ubiquinone/menaquinone biosynthesis C-methylase UbiE